MKITPIRYETGKAHGVWLGRSARIGVWQTRKPRWMFVWRNHDALFIAAWRWRMRISKPFRGRA